MGKVWINQYTLPRQITELLKTSMPEFFLPWVYHTFKNFHELQTQTISFIRSNFLGLSKNIKQIKPAISKDNFTFYEMNYFDNIITAVTYVYMSGHRCVISLLLDMHRSIRHGYCHIFFDIHHYYGGIRQYLWRNIQEHMIHINKIVFCLGCEISLIAGCNKCI